MAIVIAKLHRLGRDGDSYSKKLIAQTERTRAIVDDEFIKFFNKNWINSGRFYEIDKEATAERNSIIAKKEADQKEVTTEKRGRPRKI